MGVCRLLLLLAVDYALVFLVLVAHQSMSMGSALSADSRAPSQTGLATRGQFRQRRSFRGPATPHRAGAWGPSRGASCCRRRHRWGMGYCCGVWPNRLIPSFVCMRVWRAGRVPGCLGWCILCGFRVWGLLRWLCLQGGLPSGLRGFGDPTSAAANAVCHLHSV